jgi:acetyl esterase/lipase
MYEDISDFWVWVRRDLQPYLSRVRPGVEADLDKILVHGESAGGTISIVSAFLQPPGFIKAVIPTYPITTMIPKRTKPIFGAPPIPKSALQDHLNSMQPGKIITEASPPDRMNIAISIVQQESILSYYGTDERYDVWKLLERADDMPYVLILHGDEDSAVPVHGSIEWEAAVKKKFGAGKVKLHVERGAEHGFDEGIPLGTPWLQEDLMAITANWLGLGAH